MTRFLLAPAFRTLLVLAVVVVGGCARSHEPRVEEMVNGVYQPRAVLSYDITGQRAGATTAASALLTLENNRQLRVDLEINYNPTPVLGSGRWQLDGPGAGNGDVRAEAIKFLGGQGEGPSVGGRYRLDENGNARFRLTLPLRPLRRPAR